MTDDKKPDVTFPAMLTQDELMRAQGYDRPPVVPIDHNARSIRRHLASYDPTGKPMTAFEGKSPDCDTWPPPGLFVMSPAPFDDGPQRQRIETELESRLHKPYWDTLVAQAELSADECRAHPPIVNLVNLAGPGSTMTDHKREQPIPTVPVTEALRAENLVRYLELEALAAVGTEDQRERYNAGVLPEDELAQLARAVLFKGFGDLDLRRWASRDRDALARQVKHKFDRRCSTVLAAGGEVAATVELETCEVTELSTDEWKRLKTIQAMAAAAAMHPWLDPERTGGKVEVSTAAHWATCSTCQAEAVRSSAKVTITWAGRQLVREWAL